MTVNLSREALAVMTTPQKEALLRLATPRVKRITVQKGGLGLPDDYLAFNQQYEEGVHIYGGIDPHGRVST